MNKNIRKRERNLVFVLCFMVLFLLAGEALAGSQKADVIQQKLTEALSLRRTIIDNKEQAIILCEQLKSQMKELKEEIKSEQNRSGIKLYSKAIGCPRIKYDLKLIQQILGYISRLNESMSYFQICIDRLEFLCQQADDDLRIVETLNEMKVDALIEQIDKALNEYIPKAGKLMIDVDDMVLRDSKEIWNEIINRVLKTVSKDL